MSSEFNPFFEEYLDEGFDSEFSTLNLVPLDTQIPQYGADFHVPWLDASHSDVFSDEALNQPPLQDPMLWAPSDADVAIILPMQLDRSRSSITFTEPNGYMHNGHMHISEILSQWAGASQCPWPKCISKATFKSPSALKTHLTNIHVTPLVCTYPQCSHSRPFGKQYELDRHVATAHGNTRNHKCPIGTCDANVTGFSRKDKLLKHMREAHESVRCPYNHCFAKVIATQEQEHLRACHGDYECSMSGCEASSASRFSFKRLKRHLISAHKIDYYSALFLLNNMEDNKVRIIGGILFKEKACNTCSATLPTEASPA